MQSVSGIKRMVVELGIGAAVGVIVDLILAYIFINIVRPALATTEDPIGEEPTRIYGFSIFPNQVATDGRPFMHWDDIILIVITVAMVFSKKLFLTLGFFVGWYFSSYMGLYDALSLPHPEAPVP